MSHLAAETSSAAVTPPAVRRKLAGMMFLQYFMQGAYLPILSLYIKSGLGFSDSQVGWVMAAIGIGPVLAPFIVGQLVDRMFPTERVLAVCHLLGGLVMLAIYTQSTFEPLIALATLYSVLYVPTTMLANSLAFHHLRSPDREFPMIRVWGTIGFIAPSWLMSFYFLKDLQGEALARGQSTTLIVAGIAGLVMAGYALLLPHTPATLRGSGKFAPGVVVELGKRRDFAVLFVVTFFIAMVHSYFFVWNGPQLEEFFGRHGWGQRTNAFTTIGQITEIVAMALLAPSILKLGYKRTMIIGALAYALRCVAFSQVSSPELPVGAAVALATFGQALHGFCFAFFMAAAFIYVDRAAPSDVKGSLQTIYGVFIMGIGLAAGSVWGGRMGNLFSQSLTDAAGKTVKVYEWSPIWLWCAALAVACAVALAIFFPRATQSATADSNR